MAGNANSGRRPTPTALKLLKGTRRDRINCREPKPAPGMPAKPATLSPLASAAWDRLVPLCAGMGTLTQADGEAFSVLCELVATRELVAASKREASFRPFGTVTGADGRPRFVEHPAIRLERQTALVLARYFALFGLDPQGRARLTVPTDTKGGSKWAGLLA